MGRDRAAARGYAEDKGKKISPFVSLIVQDPSISWVVGDAEKLPFESDSFDAYTIAFGIRNCTHIDKVLAEAFRVLKKGK